MASIDTAYNPAGNAPSQKTPPTISERDIIFACPACTGELVVDRDGAGMSLPCPHCGNPLTIPETSERPLDPQPDGTGVAPLTPTAVPSPLPTPPRQFDFSAQSVEEVQRRQGDLKHQLKENRSQDTEMRGHVNRATMELHRLQLRLKKLQERQADIEAELGAVEVHLRDQTIV